jgi:3-hydroxyisobutyrate dehydrogenase-like beta-hydroxyacid dehydrogenase
MVKIERVGMVGLGAMGLPIAENIAKGGYEVVAFDLDPTIRSATVTRVETLAEVATAAVIVVIVPTDDDVLAVVSGPDGLLDHAAPGTTIVVSASVDPATCRVLGEKGQPRGVHVVDAGLTGGVRGAEAGQINLLVGGDPDVVGDIREVLDTFTKGVHVLGPLGSGQVGKSANNLVHWAEIVAITEAFRFAERLGVDGKALRTALTQGSTDSATLREMEQMRFTWYKKDLEIAQRLAGEIGIALPVASLTRELMDDVTVPGTAALFGIEG